MRRAAALVFCVVMAGGAAAALPDPGAWQVPGLAGQGPREVGTAAGNVQSAQPTTLPTPAANPTPPASPTPSPSSSPAPSPSPKSSPNLSPVGHQAALESPAMTPMATPSATPTPPPSSASPIPPARPAVGAAGVAVVVSTSTTQTLSSTPTSTPSPAPTPKPVSKVGVGQVGAGSVGPTGASDTLATTLASTFATELVPVANTPAGQRAVAWAEAELQSPDPTWSDEIGAPWSGYCEAFVEIAYGTRHIYASAKTDYLAQMAAKRIHTDNNPPAGALVFYGGGVDGHVALSIGGGQVISTWGYIGNRYPLHELAVRGFTNPYLGWSYPPDKWPGRK
jgi:hypothetical protein